MARQTSVQVNAARRSRYKQHTRKTANRKGIRNVGMVLDRGRAGLSLREIASKWGVSLGCVRGVLSKHTETIQAVESGRSLRDARREYRLSVGGEQWIVMRVVNGS